MILGLDKVLDEGEAAAMAARLAGARFGDGQASAGWHARHVKLNAQLAADDPAASIKGEVEAALRRHAIFTAATLPVRMQLLINRYGPGQSYGTHVDDAFMGGMRTDIAFTLFLSAPETYDGGELVIEGSSGEQRVKLPMGAAIVYPATTLHRVDAVTRGERLACVGWIESRVRDVAAREILFDLERARRALFSAQGKTTEFDLVSKSYSNLLRRWGG